MTDEEIISAAEATGLTLFGLGMDRAKFEFCILVFAKFIGDIERFKEREACAKVCADLMDSPELIGDCHVCVDAIRARGEKA